MPDTTILQNKPKRGRPRISNSDIQLNTGRRSRKVDPVKVLQLKQRGYTNQDIADKFGVGGSAISNTLKRTRELILSPTELKEYRTREVDILDSAKAKLISAISEDKIEKAPLGTLALAYCQLTDKSLLLQGKSTANIDIRSMSAHFSTMREDLEKEIAALKTQDIVIVQDTP